MVMLEPCSFVAQTSRSAAAKGDELDKSGPTTSMKQQVQASMEPHVTSARPLTCCFVCVLHCEVLRLVYSCTKHDLSVYRPKVPASK